MWSIVLFLLCKISHNENKTKNSQLCHLYHTCSMSFPNWFLNMFQLRTKPISISSIPKDSPFHAFLPIPLHQFLLSSLLDYYLAKYQNLASFPRKLNKNVCLLFLNSFLHLLPSYCLLYVSQNSGRRCGNMNSLLGAFSHRTAEVGQSTLLAFTNA